MKERIDLTGRRFGKLKVVRFSHKDKRRISIWECVCDCGNKRLVYASNLLRGHTTSCGCGRKGNLNLSHPKHGLCGSRIYSIWSGIRRRCNNKNDPEFKYYGGRGILVCEEWNDVEVFYEWAISHGYKDDLTIDRIDVYGNYCPDNCRWSTMKEQENNRRNNRLLAYGCDTMTVSQWSERLGIPKHTLYGRIRQGWSVERSLTTPVRSHRRCKDE